jgi:3-phosphoshikimate 1-carboxyvinyltransferase
MRAELTADKDPIVDSSLYIGGSKSESNRLLILQALFNRISIRNISDSDDTRVLVNALRSDSGTVDVHHAGTAMRFLTAYFATRAGSEVILTGSSRMQQRPLSILVEALEELGARIDYLGNQGYPPLRISGKELKGGTVRIDAGTSSQYISALLLIAPALMDGIELKMEGRVTSRPYIAMTRRLLEQIGARVEQTDQALRVYPLKEIQKRTITVESDWSSASYFYSMAALRPGTSIELFYYKEDSLQGDSELVSIYREFGVESVFGQGGSLKIRSSNTKQPDRMLLDLRDTPDLAQTIAVSCLGLQIPCRLEGLHTLSIKETDRLLALKTEIGRLGTDVVIGPDFLEIREPAPLKPEVLIQTYNDHRMAMAFAPLALLVPLSIDDPEVVSKSFPTYWDSLVKLGIKVDFKR